MGLDILFAAISASGAKQVYLSISQIAVPLYLAKVVVGRSHPFVGLRHFRPLAARWERLQ